MTQEVLLIIIKELQKKNYRVIFTADRHSRCFSHFKRELIDFFNGGLILEIKNKRWRRCA